MNEKILIVRESVIKLTQMLAGQGIQVTQRGTSAYVKSTPEGRPFLVNIPYIPDNATDELIAAIQGFLDHEVAHVLFTDFKVVSSAQRNPRVANMLNAIEDTRIEREMANKYQGCASNLADTGEFFLKKYIQPRFDKAQKEGDTEGMIATLMVPQLRALADQSVFKEFMSKHSALMTPVTDKLSPLAGEIQACKTTADALKVTMKVLKALDEDDRDGATPPPKSTPKPKSGKSGPKSKSKDKSEPKEKDESEDDGEGEGKGEPKESPEGESKDESEGGGEEGGGEDGEGEGEEGEGEEGEGEEGESGGTANEAGRKPPPESETDISKGSGSLASKIDTEMKNGYDEAVSSTVTFASQEAAKSSNYLVYTKENDVIEPLRVGKHYSSKMLTDLEEKVGHMVGPLQKDLERAISAKSLSTYSSGHRSGRLHPANLSRLIAGDARVFRRKHEANSKDVAVSLVIDMSGSMSGSKITIAAATAFALSSVLERIGIQHEVICFTTSNASPSSEMSKEESMLGRRYSRKEALYMPTLKCFGERLTIKNKERFAWLPHVDDLRNNVDGESVEIAARRLLARREKGKVMIVLSDGSPACDGSYGELSNHLQKTVNDVMNAGIKVVGIGIQSNSVKTYYPKNVVMNDVNELPMIVMKELRSLIIG